METGWKKAEEFVKVLFCWFIIGLVVVCLGYVCERMFTHSFLPWFRSLTLGGGGAWLLSLYIYLLNGVGTFASVLFPQLADLTLVIGDTYKYSAMREYVPAECKGITMEEALTLKQCLPFAEEHLSIYRKFAALLVHVIFVAIYINFARQVGSFAKVAIAISCVAVAMDWEQVRFALSLVIPLLFPLISNQWFVCSVSISSLLGLAHIKRQYTGAAEKAAAAKLAAATAAERAAAAKLAAATAAVKMAARNPA